MRRREFPASIDPQRAPPGIVKGGGGGSVNRRRPLKPLEEHFRVLQKEQLSLLRIS